MRLSILGLPGVGKSSLARELSDIFKVMCVSVEQLCHENFTPEPTEKELNKFVLKAIGDSDAYILDGYPCTKYQASRLPRPFENVVYLNAPTDVCAERLMTQKVIGIDDVMKLYQTHYTSVYPHLLQYYEEQRCLLCVDATGGPSEILAKTMVGLSKKGLWEVEHYLEYFLKHNYESKHS